MKHPFKVKTKVDGKDGERYEVLVVEKELPGLPQMTRYKVRRLSDNVTIENFPGYLLKETK